MAVRQYIGARYTPRFMGEYVSTQRYEALDVVDNGLGTSYIAKKLVPPGTSLTNTEYWTIYGAASGAVYDLQTRMTAAEADIDDLEAEDVKINNRITRRFIIVSDSYGYHDPDFITYMRDRLGIDEYYMYNGSLGGAGFGENCRNKFVTGLENIEEEVADKDSITDIIVAGGFNDASHASTYSEIVAGMTEFVNYARTTYPNAKFGVIYIGWTMGNVVNPTTLEPTTFATYKQAILSCIDLYNRASGATGMAFMGYTSPALNTLSMFQEDFIHPSESGQNVIADYLISVIFGNGNINFVKALANIPCSWIVNNAAEDDTVDLLRYRVSDGNAYVTFNANSFDLTNSISFVFSRTYQKLALLRSDDVNIINGSIVNWCGNMYIRYLEDNVNKYMNVVCNFMIENNILYYCCPLPNDNGSNYHDALTVNRIITLNRCGCNVPPINI